MSPSATQESMKHIQVVFGIRIIEGIEFPEIFFANITPEYKNITLSPIDADKSLYEILVKKNFNPLASSELRSVIQEATVEAQTFVYVFSVAADVKIFEFACKGYKHKNCLISLDQELNQGSRVGIQVQPTVIKGPATIARIKENMKQHYDLSKLQIFFDSATVTEPIGRFVSLYTLMLHDCDDSQRKVDKVTLGIDSTVAEYKSPQGNWYETVFTKLRNELSHKRDGVNILETHDQVRKNVERFERIVKAHILRTD